jgi:sporulation protein YlmC with PRC-barrel domain
MRQVLLASAALVMMSAGAFAQTAPNHASITAQPARMAANTQAASGSGMFVNVPAQEQLSSNVVGLDVYNSANDNIGKIKDVAFDANGVKAYILSVGGIAGVGSHYVAVDPSAMRISYDANAKKWHAAMNSNADSLKAAPEYKYSSNG